MADLERELRALGAVIELPPERDLVPAVRARLAERRRRLSLRPLAVALAVLVVGFGVALAVPPARSAILRFLGLQSVTVIRVDRLPPAATGPAALGERVSLAEAERRLSFRPLVPDELGPPDAVYVGPFQPEFVILLYGRPETRVRLTELQTGSGYVSKFASTEQRVDRVRVDGRPGIWVEGRHVVVELFGQPRLSGNVLLWERDGLTLRLEGRLTRGQAVRIGGSLR